MLRIPLSRAKTGSFPADQDESEKLMCRRDSTGVKGCCDWFQPHQSPRLRFFLLAKVFLGVPNGTHFALNQPEMTKMWVNLNALRPL